MNRFMAKLPAVRDGRRESRTRFLPRHASETNAAGLKQCHLGEAGEPQTTWTYMAEAHSVFANRCGDGNTSNILQDVAHEIVRGAQEYAATLEPSTRTSVRARVLSLIDRFAFGAGTVEARRIGPEELSSNSLLRGAVQLHVDLVFRASVSSEELLYTAAHGWLYVAIHSGFVDFPVGVALALPAVRVVRRVDELFQPEGLYVDDAGCVVLYSMATNPPRLGAGACLIHTLKDASRGLARAPSLVAFSPLTGMRARVIRVVDDPVAWSEVGQDGEDLDKGLLRAQLYELLAMHGMPDEIPQPARGWLGAEAMRFAASGQYRAGSFHRSMGARLVGLSDCGDASDGESMWMRAYHEYDV